MFLVSYMPLGNVINIFITFSKFSDLSLNTPIIKMESPYIRAYAVITVKVEF
jgi:hypothetical protein